MARQTEFAQLIETIDDVPRDLAFHPSTVTEPKVLTGDQVASYNANGYVKGIQVFDEAEMLAHRCYFDVLLEKAIAEGGNSYSLSSAHLTYAGAYDLLTHPRIVAYVKDILGDNVIGWGAHYFCKLPKDGKRVSWHQDASYWPMTPSKTVTVWLAIDDADVENACMRFIPTSHLHGHLTYHLSEEDENNVLNQTVANAEELGAPVDVELKAGEVSMHSDLLLHGSEANESNRRRCGITLRYCAADVRAYMGWNDKGVVVSGKDETGLWTNPLRPELD
ncbi:MAG: phytanoyl-CoA dioxygenase family protein [Candidatus Latescibacteria bacterium]|jgi:non-haem Fe2+, alpha-ketoglutarate-dependent halogenase|nr:phytanoyl-CoA dioxygenase family protein [Candidatus Latescibacterota bacterium]MBT4137800.1 phytanoyl-CoA dioxygenase family protein [Candidatus Latescibacterota bacterium]